MLPKWARDGRELFYLSEEGLMSAPMSPVSGLPAGRPGLLFRASRNSYGVGVDGRFLMIQPPKSVRAAHPITVVLNWFEALKVVAK